MSAFPLSEARSLWFALLSSGAPCSASWWRDWADAQILYSDATPPSWMCDLSIASTHDEALRAVAADIGYDKPSTSNVEELLIGFVAGRYFNGELPFDAMWTKLCELTDIAEFLDSGRWEPYAITSGNRSRAPASDVATWLRPVASFADQQASSLLSVSSYGPNKSFKPKPLRGSA